MKNLMKSLREYATLFAALLLFFVSPHVLRWVDPTAGSYDAGVLQVIIMAILQFCVFQAFVWFTIKLIWPGVALYIQTSFNHDLKSLEKWQKVFLSLVLYLSLFLLLALLSRVM